MFEKSLQDLVKGIRSHKRDPSAFISQSIQEIKQELKSVDPFVKAQAVRKLTYLQMMGYDMSWASFAVVEVMSSPRFAHKRIGYLAACQTFTETTDVVLLTTNLLKKEFQSPNQYEVGLAVNCLANIVTRDLARDLIGDVVALINHSKPYVRKKSVLSLYKLYVKYPQGLRLTFDKLKEKLDDPESAVVSCGVNVICELANKNPKNYLALAPKFFRLLTTSSNNWMLIKVVKLLGSLVPEEPRLARKLLEPLATIVQNTAAKSLLYECIHTVTLALPFARKSTTDPATAAAGGAEAGGGGGGGKQRDNLQAVVSLCAEHLRQFVEDPDQNLKYLGLVGFVNLMKSYPKAVAEHKELVLRCLADDDVTIRTKALELLTGMVTRRNLTELVHKLMQHVLLAEGAYRDEIIAKVIFMCSRDKYAYLSDVPWYVSVLVDLAYVQGPVHGPLVAAQLIDVAVRAEAVRDYAVRCMLGLLLDASGLFLGQSQATMAHVLYAAGWIVGEYASHLPAQAGAEEEEAAAADGLDLSRSQQSQQQQHALALGWPATPAAVFLRVMEACLDPRATSLPEEVQVVYMQNALKALAAAVRLLGDDGDLAPLLAVLRSPRLLVFLQSVHIEVQERAATLRNLLAALGVLPPLPSPAPANEAENEESGSEGEAEGEGDKPQPAAAAATADLLGGTDGGDGGGVDLMLLGGEGGSGGEPQPALVADDGVRALRLHQGLLAALFVEQLAPVNPRAQRKVPVPEGLDLDAPFDAKAQGELESYGGGFPRDADLSRVCFTHVYVEPAPLEEQEAPSPLGTPGRLGGYEEAFGADSPLDAAAGRRRWQGTPFYLSSSTAAAGAGGEEGPMAAEGAMLMAADLEGGRRRSKKERKKHRRRRRGEGEEDEEEQEQGDGGRRYAMRAGGAAVGGAAVLRDEVMPAGAVDSGSDGERGKARLGARGDEDAVDLKDIDITTPLRPDEVIPRMQHRAAAPTAAATEAAAAKKRKHRRKEPSLSEKAQQGGSSPPKKGGGGGRSRRSKRSGPGGGGGGGDAGGDLIDFGDFGGGGTGAPVASSSSARRDSADTRRLKADAMDLLMFGDSYSPQRPSAPASAAAAATTTRGSDDMLGLGLGSSPPKQRRKGKERENEKEKEKGRRRKASSSSAAPAPAPAAPLLDIAVGGGNSGDGSSSDAPGSLRALRFPLCKAGGVKVEFSLAPSPAGPGRGVTVHLRAKNAAAPSSPTPCLRLLPPFPAGLSPEAEAVALSKAPLAVGASAKASVVLRLGPEAWGRSLAVPVRLELGGSTADGADLLLGSGAAAATVKKEGKLLLPASASLRPGALSPQGFTALLSGANREVAWHEGSVRLKRGRKSSSAGSFDATVGQIAAFFQAQTIEKTPPAAAALYATTAKEEHVAILAKFTGGERDGDVLLSVKSSSQPLVADLMADAQALLGPSL